MAFIRIKSLKERVLQCSRLACAACLALAITAVQAQAPKLEIQLHPNHVQLSITGNVNTRHDVQYATDLSATNNWQSFTNLLVTTNSYVLTDANAPATGQRFYRVVATTPIVTVSNAQLQDMCSRLTDQLAISSNIPETIVIGGSNTNVVTAAELHGLMTKWLRHYQTNGAVPPATVTISGGIRAPQNPVGLENGTIYLADILTVAATNANYIESNGALPDSGGIGALQYTTKALLSVFARTINWYQDHTSTMPAFATVKPVTAPGSWPVSPLPNGIKVALFNDPDGGSTTAESVNATINILSTNSGFNVSTISAVTIRADGLTNYDVVMFPAGNATGQANALGQTGCAKVEQFVAGGGGLVGTCAGAYLVSLGYNPQTAWLELVDSQIMDVDHWDRGVAMVQIHLVTTNHPILTGFPEFVTAQYINGPLFAPGNNADIPDYTLNATYVTDVHDNGPVGVMPGKGAMTTSTYQSGRCVMFGFHPELTPGLEQMKVRAVKWAAGKL